jgi:hypothetical protein
VRENQAVAVNMSSMQLTISSSASCAMALCASCKHFKQHAQLQLRCCCTNAGSSQVQLCNQSVLQALQEGCAAAAAGNFADLLAAHC